MQRVHVSWIWKHYGLLFLLNLRSAIELIKCRFPRPVNLNDFFCRDQGVNVSRRASCFARRQRVARIRMRDALIAQEATENNIAGDARTLHRDADIQMRICGKRRSLLVYESNITTNTTMLCSAWSAIFVSWRMAYTHIYTRYRDATRGTG